MKSIRSLIAMTRQPSIFTRPIPQNWFFPAMFVYFLLYCLLGLLIFESIIMQYAQRAGASHKIHS